MLNKKNVFQIGHFTDTCHTSVGIQYVSELHSWSDMLITMHIKASLFRFQYMVKVNHPLKYCPP